MGSQGDRADYRDYRNVINLQDKRGKISPKGGDKLMSMGNGGSPSKEDTI